MQQQATGTGSAFGAVSLLNATASGRGCALAIDGGVEATWQWTGDGFAFTGESDDRLARAVDDVIRGHFARGRKAVEAGSTVATKSSAPPARGLKTSSSAAAAMVRAACNGADLAISDDDATLWSVEASLQAGVTLTGAYDDQVATVMGGCHVTDNAQRTILGCLATEPWHVAVWNPDHDLPKSRVATVDASDALTGARRVEALLWDGRLAQAMTENGRVFTHLYRAAGLPVDDHAAQVALAAGAHGAGLSGTGPAIAALFDDPVDLPAVPGGEWMWRRHTPGCSHE